MALPPFSPPPKPATVDPAELVALKAVIAGLVTLQAEEFNTTGRGSQANYIALLADMCRGGLETSTVTVNGAPAEKTKARALQHLNEFFAAFHYGELEGNSQG